MRLLRELTTSLGSLPESELLEAKDSEKITATKQPAVQAERSNAMYNCTRDPDAR